MDENESTSKRGNTLNEDEREIANMDESDFFFLLMEHGLYPLVGSIPSRAVPAY